MKEQESSCNEQFAWTDSFADYRAVSNENERVASAFADLVLPRLVRTDCLSWVDIGCGDCCKTAIHARLLWEASVSGRATVTLVDPCFPDLLPVAAEYVASIVELLRDVRLLVSDLEHLVSFHKPSEPSAQLVTAVHSVHTSLAAEALMTLLCERANVRHPTTFFVVTESPQSDFYRIRRALEHCGANVPRPYTDELCDYAHGIGARVTRKSISNQYCLFDRTRIMEDERYWLFPFLLGETAKSYSSRPRATRRGIREVLCEFIADLRSDQLSTPDEALLIELIR